MFAPAVQSRQCGSAATRGACWSSETGCHASFSYMRDRQYPAQKPVPAAENPIMKMTSYLPGMASHAALSEWIETHETLVSSVLLMRSGGLRALFLSEDDQGNCLLRLCEGVDDSWMVWVDQRRTRSRFGRSYAGALLKSWLSRLEGEGWRVEWSARFEDERAVFDGIAAAA